MSTLFPKTIAYKQVTFTRDSHGRAVNSETDATFQGSVQPVSGKEFENLEDGRKDFGTVKVYSSTRLNVSLEGSNKRGDLITWQNQQWELGQELIYQNSLIPHYKYFAFFRKEPVV